MTEQRTIQVDRLHRLHNDGSRWAIQKLTKDGWNLLTSWTGDRRSVFARLESLEIFPSREAEQALAAIPESTGFRDRTPTKDVA